MSEVKFTSNPQHILITTVIGQNRVLIAGNRGGKGEMQDIGT